MRGIVYTFQITSIFPSLTCYENVALAAQRRLMRSWHNRLVMAEGPVTLTVEHALNSVCLAADTHRRAGELAYGHQRLLELAMGLTLKPTLFILDEPTQGLAPAKSKAFVHSSGVQRSR